LKRGCGDGFQLMMRKMAQEQLHTRGCDTRAMIEFSDALFEADLVVGTGGGYLTDSFAEHAMDILETLHLAQRLGISTALLGQGLGPVSQDRVWNPMMRVLPRLDLLTLREGAKGIELARKAGGGCTEGLCEGDDGVRLAHEARSQVWEANVGCERSDGLVCVRGLRRGWRWFRVRYGRLGGSSAHWVLRVRRAET
jgi:colanic acid/amylovoran biosynthesis protein